MKCGSNERCKNHTKMYMYLVRVLLYMLVGSDLTMLGGATVPKQSSVLV
eukprot:COSAG02_NODE_92_length_37588_cov_135.916242_8_plen_49_part_00